MKRVLAKRKKAEKNFDTVLASFSLEKKEDLVRAMHDLNQIDKYIILKSGGLWPERGSDATCLNQT